MNRSYLVGAVLALTFGTFGCRTGAQKAVCADPCPPDACPAGAEDIVVHAPPQKVIVKTPAPCPPEVAAIPPGFSQGAPPGAPQGAPGVPQGLMGVSQGVSGFGAQPLLMGVPQGASFGAAGSGNSSSTVTTNQRVRMALSFTTIRIPVPWLKLIPITEPMETTIRITGQATQSQGLSAVPVGVMPGAAFGTSSLPGAPGSFVQGQVVGPPVAQGVVGAQGFQAQGVCPPCPPADPNAITPERLKALTKKIEELEAAKKAQEEGKK